MNPLKFETNDIVRLKEGAKYKVYRIDNGENNIYRIESHTADAVRLGYISEFVPYWDIEPIPIDGKSDKPVYLKTIVAASTVTDVMQAPVRKIDRTYYVDALKKIGNNGKTLYDEFIQQDFQYVHEVQHWLREKHGGMDLKIDENKLLNKYMNQLESKKKKMTHDDYMQLAIAEMKKCRQERRNDGKVSPSVAAVLIKPNGEVVTAYRSELREGDHAEYTLLERKCGSENLEGSILYSTLEPCAPGARHYPKLSCAERIVNARIKKVYIGREDPDPTVARKGFVYLQENGVETELFPKQYEDIITDYNAEFIKQAEERARQKAEEGSKEIILSSIENEGTTVRFDDLDASLLQKYLERYGARENINSGYARSLFLQAGILIQKEEEIIPSGIGVLLFGKDPQLTYPNAKICATMIIGGEEHVKYITGPLLNQPKQVEEWFELTVASTIDRTHAEHGTIYKYPPEMLRELVANAILHRDYDIQEAAIQLRVTDDEIVIMSPGAPVKPIQLKDLQDFTAPTLSRNPKIISVFNLFHYSEQRGFGFRTVRKSLDENQIPLPIVTYKAPYLVTTMPRNYEVAMSDTKLKKTEKQILDYMRLHGAVSRQQCQDAMQLSERTANRILKGLVDAGYIEPQGDSTSTKYAITEKARQNQ